MKESLIRKVYGNGITDLGDYKATVGRRHTPEYSAWKRMLQRCYSDKYHETHPTYKDCTVCEEWLYFQNFAKWYSDNTFGVEKPFHLDKDLLFYGNKVYSPDSCMIVPQAVNQFINDKSGSRGSFMIGVHYCNFYKKYRSQCMNSITKNHKNLGLFESELEAHKAWRKFKSKIAYELANIQSNPNVRLALLKYKEDLDSWVIFRDGKVK